MNTSNNSDEGGQGIASYPGPFTKLETVTTKMATSVSVVLDNVRYAITLSHKRFHEHPEFMQIKDRSKAICLIGGGPSLKDPIVQKELKDLKASGAKLLACGSSNDWLYENGFVVDYTAICDPDAISANYLKYVTNQTEYLISTQCDIKVFDRLKDQKVFMWHCYAENFDEYYEIEPGFHAIGGGCTVGLRSISLAMMLGYTNIHFFGFDSCLNSGASHAYDFVGEDEQLGDVYNIKLGIDTPGEKTYRCAGYQLAQVEHFKMFLGAYGNTITPTIHGEGLLKDFYDIYQKDLKNLREGMYALEAQYKANVKEILL